MIVLQVNETVVLVALQDKELIMLKYDAFIKKANLRVIDPLDLKSGDLFTCRSFYDTKDPICAVSEFVGFREGNFVYKAASNRLMVIAKKDYHRYKFYLVGSNHEYEKTLPNLVTMYDVGMMHKGASFIYLARYSLIGRNLPKGIISFEVVIAMSNYVKNAYITKYRGSGEGIELKGFNDLPLYSFFYKQKWRGISLDRKAKRA